jgi:hypothetical protein
MNEEGNLRNGLGLKRIQLPSKSIRTATKLVRTISFVNLNNLSWITRKVGKGNIIS